MSHSLSDFKVCVLYTIAEITMAVAVTLCIALSCGFAYYSQKVIEIEAGIYRFEKQKSWEAEQAQKFEDADNAALH